MALNIGKFVNPVFRTASTLYEVASEGIATVPLAASRLPGASEPTPAAAPAARQPSLRDLRVPDEVARKFISYWRPGSYRIEAVSFDNPLFHVHHDYTRLTYRGSRKAILLIDQSFIDRPANQAMLDDTLREFAFWEDTLERQGEREVCILSEKVDAPFLRVRLSIQSWNHGSRVSIIPWRDVDYIESFPNVTDKRRWIRDMLGLKPVETPNTVEFLPEEVQRLTAILANTEAFLNQTSRKATLYSCGLFKFWAGELTGDMNAEFAATVYLQNLAGVGRPSPTTPTPIGTLLSYIRDRPYLPTESKEYIQGILDKYSLLSVSAGEDD